MRLHELQAAFAVSLRGDAVADGLDEAIRAGAFSVAERLSIHRNNHRLTLAGALASAYPVLETLIGSADFARLAAHYVAATPSVSGDLHAYGAGFADFVAGFAPLAQWPWHADLARLEWAVHEAYYAADAETRLSLEMLAALPPAQHAVLTFVARPSLRLVASDWPVLDLWAANRDGSTAVPASDLDAGPRHWLLWRRDGEHGDIAIVPVTAGEWTLAAALAGGQPLEAACAAALAADADCAPGPALGRLLALGLWTGIG